ncbi:potassium/proton antiporter regulatory subunit (CPA2 family) [Halopolyspora algeriensis]|uniref:Potassium/proton antiporter regulatory subunit (CPA2 family) n=1 Tax=Halopolyspora algeriensis TaxID=1500506 RepID=A0A368VSS6_9ACTN|nr:TrkA C-terminal domain-containing protein [Halopolyspora algeriensis]RCW44715.1 potassium/proton antiporter regulatory subunit (CPA2 family) [Halopolyspora algeriensis]TQM56072.1 potassium/proton antiporter regulatory subunit (CPA2 family) [Halopolyspora algeriensis]
MDVTVTPLPGLGTQQDFITNSGHRVGVISYRDGRLELIVSGPQDPDKVAASVELTTEETSALANLLGAPQLVAQLTEQQREVTGITTWQLPITQGSPYDGRALGDTEMRTRTSVSIVAIVREGTAHPSPRPDFEFTAGDLLVMVGTVEGLRSANEILEKG